MAEQAMKLGAALTLRARQAQKLENLRARIKANAKTQDGEDPAEDASKLIDQFRRVSADHAALLARITKTNLSVTTDDGTLVDTLHKREAMRRERNVLALAAHEATPQLDSYRYMRSELALKPQLNVEDLQAEIERIEQEIAKVDAYVQELNWKSELL